MLQFNMNHYIKLYKRTHQIGTYPKSEHTNQMLDDSLKDVSAYLDGCDIRMKPADFPYFPDDQTTWKWIQKPKGHKSSCWHIRNPDCIYADI